LEWVLEVIPGLEANGVLSSEIRYGLFSAMLGHVQPSSAFLWTNFGVLEVLRLPDGLSEADLTVREWPESAYTPQAADEGPCSWHYEVAVTGFESQRWCSAHRMFFVGGSGIVGLAREEELAKRTAEALAGRRLP
jgi:hypothetical protein